MDNSNYSEEDAIESAMVGQEDGYRYLLTKYQRYAFSIAIGIVRNEENAEEVVQDSFIRIFKHISKFNKSGKFSTWLYRIVYNTSLTSLRRKRKIDFLSLNEPENYDLEIPDNYSNGFDDLMKGDKVKFVNKAIARLSEAENLAIILYYTNECSITEISQITGWNTSTIKTRLYRGRQNLYLELSKLLGNEAKEI
ncbi:RNA polymerase sigma factor [Flagellimonas sp.]|uniref:RNA polymerase sigma factor n=1 Tax=Flagellimonas sp. TaxID=2058762 RepID=UPI003B51F8F4